MQLECNLCEVIRFSLEDVPWPMMDCSHAPQGEVLSQKKSFGTISGVMSQSTKMKGCQTAQKEGRRG